MRQRHTGFTLIELMIAVAIVGILAAIAIPSYQESVMKSRRADAKGALMSLANAMERHFTETNTYCNAGGTGGTNVCPDGDATLDSGQPSVFPTTGATSQYYTLTIDSATISANRYTLLATPVSTSAQANDKCGVLSLNNLGERNATKGGSSVSGCWD